MNDMGWTQYNARLEAGEERACLEHRKKFGLTGLGDEDGMDCEEKPCSKGCPFAPKIREGATLKIHPTTRTRLKDAGKKGETYDDIINRILEYPCSTCDGAGKRGPNNPPRCETCEEWKEYIKCGVVS